MKSLDEQLAAYGSHHTKKGTKITHMIGIPAVILGLLILFTWIRLDFFNSYTIAISWILIIGTLIYYCCLDKRIAGIMAIIFIPITLITTWLTGPEPTAASIWVFFILFVGGWIVQFIGHGIEKKQPAFFSGLFQIFIAPVFIVLEIFEMCGIDARSGSSFGFVSKKPKPAAKAKVDKTSDKE